MPMQTGQKHACVSTNSYYHLNFLNVPFIYRVTNSDGNISSTLHLQALAPQVSAF